MKITGCQLIPMALVALISTWNLSGSDRAPDAARPEQKQEQKQKPSKGKDDTTSLSGCIDEDDGHYVLLNDKTRDPIANLEAQGFPTEGFAKHVGHKVTVRGTSSSDSTRPVFRVRAIETISDVCSPQLQL